MKKELNNYAYIDGANLHKGVESLGWNMDYQKKEKFATILSPSNEKKCSILLKRTGAKIAYLNDQQSNLKLAQKEKAPDEDRTP